MFGRVCVVVIGQDQFQHNVSVTEKILDGRRAFVVATNVDRVDASLLKVGQDLFISVQEGGGFAVLDRVRKD